MRSFTVAAVQLTSDADRGANLERALALVAKAADAGAELIATPENTDQIAPRDRRMAEAETLEGPFVQAFRDAAKRHGRWILLGSFAERAAGGRIHNTSVLVDPEGAIAGVYRKIHLFDADPPDGVKYRESDTVTAGREPVSVPTPLATLGLSVCYDLRFPELFRALATRGTEVFTVPAAFTVPTGRAHWELLLRARAVENLAFVVAPAQVGSHGGGRASYGRSLVVDPWGDVLADAGLDAPGLAIARLDADRMAAVRRMLPALEHRRL